MTADFKQGLNLAGSILASGQIAGTTATTIYTVPASSAAKVATFALFNTSATVAVTVTVYVVPSGQTATTSRILLGSYSLSANDGMTSEDVLSFLKGAMLDAGSFLSVQASVGATLNYLLTGAVSS